MAYGGKHPPQDFPSQHESGTLAARPAFGIVDRYYWATDIDILFRDTGAAWEVAAHGILYHRYIAGVFREELAGVNPGTTLALLTPIQVINRATIDRLGVIVRTAAGNHRLALYEDNGDLPDGGARVVQTASVAAVVNRQEIAIADTELAPGLYWLAHQNDGAGLWIEGPNVMFYTGGTLQGRRLNMAYGAFPDPCPVTIYGEGIYGFLRVASTP